MAEEYHTERLPETEHSDFSPTPPNFFPENIPQELKNRAQWMGTRFKPRGDGKTDKPPYRVRAGYPVVKAAKTNPDNWATHREALQALERGDVDAIGVVITEADPYYVVDGDWVVDPDTGEMHPEAARVIHTMDSYTELSVSGRGFHIIAKGTKPDFAKCESSALGFDIEVYDHARFLVLTGRRIGPHADPQHRQEPLEALCKRLWAYLARRKDVSQPPGEPVDLADTVLLERARGAGTGAKFRKLFDRGDITDYPSASEADYALLNMLIFWTAGERERIVRLFEESALYRREEKHRGYVERSVDSALGSYVGSFYRPRDVEKARREEPSEADPLTPYLELLLNPALWRGRKGASAYKAYAGAVMLAAEDGVVSDDGTLRIGCDIRRLAEAAGTSFQTLSASALPHLITGLKLVRWRRGKGTKAGVLILRKKGGVLSLNTKVTTHFSVQSQHDPKNALETLRLLIRMRSGYAKRAKLLRLGMVGMFATIALAFAPRRGQNIEELEEATGRRKSDLRRALAKLKQEGIAREYKKDNYRLTDDFVREYERVLEESGITYSEREQRRRHAEDRKARGEKLAASKQEEQMHGKERVARNVEERAKEVKQRQAEEERSSSVAAARAFLAEEMRTTTAVGLKDALWRWRLRGGGAEELYQAVQTGPWHFRYGLTGDRSKYICRNSGAGAEEDAGPNARAWRKLQPELEGRVEYHQRDCGCSDCAEEVSF
jgi:putative DNA primase/helicase